MALHIYYIFAILLAITITTSLMQTCENKSHAQTMSNDKTNNTKTNDN
jgi:hypothetical protein